MTIFFSFFVFLLFLLLNGSDHRSLAGEQNEKALFFLDRDDDPRDGV
jgi:hypothetical protein